MLELTAVKIVFESRDPMRCGIGKRAARLTCRISESSPNLFFTEVAAVRFPTGLESIDEDRAVDVMPKNTVSMVFEAVIASATFIGSSSVDTHQSDR
jgi:hypothetical protein